MSVSRHIALDGQPLCLHDLEMRLGTAEDEIKMQRSSATRRAAAYRGQITKAKSQDSVDILGDVRRADCPGCLRRLEKRPQLHNAAYARSLLTG